MSVWTPNRITTPLAPMAPRSASIRWSDGAEMYRTRSTRNLRAHSPASPASIASPAYGAMPWTTAAGTHTGSVKYRKCPMSTTRSAA